MPLIDFLQTTILSSGIHQKKTFEKSFSTTAISLTSTSASPTNDVYEGTLSRGPKQVVLSPPRPKRIIVGVTGATGTLFAIRILQVLKSLGIETHLIMSKWAVATMKYETSTTEAEVRALATASYTLKDMSAPPSSGSFLHDGMIIVPCSMKTLAAVRIGYCDDLISRSADVCLKERRRLVMAIRETPLSDIHLENMLSLRKAGAVIFPPVPAFYTRPKTIDDLINQSVGRMLDALDIHTEEFERWTGFQKSGCLWVTFMTAKPQIFEIRDETREELLGMREEVRIKNSDTVASKGRRQRGHFHMDPNLCSSLLAINLNIRSQTGKLTPFDVSKVVHCQIRQFCLAEEISCEILSGIVPWLLKTYGSCLVVGLLRQWSLSQRTFQGAQSSEV
ncbi:hypothetical protein KCV00_g36, partial [Aureobasidium melanogenum]